MLALLLSGEKFPAGKNQRIGWACAIFEKLTKKIRVFVAGRNRKKFCLYPARAFCVDYGAILSSGAGLALGWYFYALDSAGWGGCR